ncbi:MULTISPECIES: metal ABC transporter solute-binding protein, Zn/Mn family [unclassified Acinetobacter]|uniref:metal ABC transporter solute-binding protein, Zn/Mn family n=1 Tax=unclassified Acinetobacter TaxID=196816 RepID=UPI002934112B|nr:MULTISPECIES: zinc ABC transporter substrate-binding protein [unclassified Acinetobacter]WOE30727.1 zinc ABC transporter substrate-binding protein [Acinetobacter sp. SAAs470]WOE38920.1 zinc ABC transporter substrate-binding protein [Acinetobacter sp. SAAs474]
MSRLFMLLSLLICSSLGWTQGLVVSTYPIYLIAKQVTQGVEQPTLLLENQSGHDVTLTPLHRKMINDASLVIWLGPQHEAPLSKLLEKNPLAISILNSDLVQTLPQRNTRGEVLANTMNTHVWLDPNNAIRIGFFIAALRSQQQPEFKTQYWNNAQNFAKDMLAASAKYRPDSMSHPYWAYHDAYQYLERPLNLKFAGALTADPHVAPTLAQIKYLNDHRPYRRMCLLAEGHASANQYQKLQPIVFQKVDESMAGEQNFIQAWSKLAAETQKCVLSEQK